MQCPKCGHQQRDGGECKKCGLIFAKYLAAKKRRKEEDERVAKAGNARTSFVATVIKTGLLIVVVASVTYYFTRPDRSTEQLDVAGNSETTDLQEPPVSTSPAVRESRKDDEKNDPKVVMSSPIEHARKATVSVETPWGTGSGFFVDKNFIVTNKHVVEFDKASLEEARQKLETNRRLIDLEDQKLDRLRRQMKRMAGGPERSQLEIILQEREKQLEKYRQQQEEGERRFAELEKDSQYPEIQIILSDGTSYTAEYIVMSEDYDLALLSLFAYDGTVLERAPFGRSVKQGDKVFTIGSPVGLRHTVTSGVFSGYRKRESDDHLFLQTDAPINPGNSGGPLIDENGYVHGVNTMILRDTEGIGFAIPIDRVFSEFATSLP